MIHLLLVIIYISFISLGLPDGLLGSAWPSMYESLAVPVSFAGIISMIISGGTILSALFSERLVKKLGTGRVTTISVTMTAIALFGFSISTEFWQLCLLGIPYGLGAGSVDAALNNYVAVHYKSRHMSWLHCFWGVGCSCGPYFMSYFLSRGESWSSGYFSVFLLQAVLTAVLFFSLPLWRKKSAGISGEKTGAGEVLGLKRTIAIPGVKEMMITFLCYCAIEQTTSLWAVSYIVFEKEIAPDKAAGLGAIFFLGITVGRFLSGFLTAKYSDKQMVRIGNVILAAGIFTLILPFGNIGAIAGLFLIGLGCAPIYPCLIHSTPERFGDEKSQAVIGVQMASAYVGSTFIPPLFGILADHTSIALLPVYIGLLLAMMFLLSERLNGMTECLLVEQPKAIRKAEKHRNIF